jgi:hypothetical protein
MARVRTADAPGLHGARHSVCPLPKLGNPMLPNAASKPSSMGPLRRGKLFRVSNDEAQRSAPVTAL